MVIPDSVKALYEKTIKSQWDGRADIYVRKNATDEATKRTVQTEVAAAVAIPCRVSFGTAATAPPLGDMRGAPPLIQTITLFIDYDVPPGSKIVVTQNGVTTDYGASGVPKVYTLHREIALEKWKGWA